MELKRRDFLKALAAAALAAAAPAIRLLPRAVRARIAARYPGPLRAANGREVRQPGRWTG